jgi:hypothetical protein
VSDFVSARIGFGATPLPRYLLFVLCSLLFALCSLLFALCSLFPVLSSSCCLILALLISGLCPVHPLRPPLFVPPSHFHFLYQSFLFRQTTHYRHTHTPRWNPR